MKILSSLLASCLVATLGAQTQTLVIQPTGAGLTYNSLNAANHFDLTVSTTVTLRALNVPCQSPLGQEGSIELWQVPTTHIGNEQIQANWQLIATAPFTSAGYAVKEQCCMTAELPLTNTELQPGTYGFAIVFNNIRHQFFGVTAYPGTPYADANLSVTNGTVQAVAWTSAPLNAFTFGGTNYLGTQPDFEILYDVGSVPHACGEVSYLGTGSFRNTASFYQRFDTAAAASAALQGQSLLMTNLGSGYLVGTGTSTFFPAPGGETYLAAADDAEYQVTLPNLPILYPHPDGVTGTVSTMDIYISTNGYVSTEPQSAIGFWALDPNACMDADAQSWYCFHDFNTAEAGSGQIWYFEDLNNLKFYVTYDNVESYPNGTVNQSRVQFQFDLITGNVETVYDTIDPVGGGTIILQDSTMIGWSPAGLSPEVDPFDFATLGSPIVKTLPEQFPLNLEIANQPLVGGQVDLITSQEPSLSIGINLADVSTAIGAPLPLDLILGSAPGTTTWIDPTTAILSTISNIPGAGSMTLSIPIAPIPTLAGIEVFTQSFWLDLGAPGLFINMVSSQCGRFVLGNF